MANDTTSPQPFRLGLLTRSEAAALLGVSSRTLQAWWTKRSGPAPIKYFGQVRYTVEEIQQFLARSQQRRPEAEPRRRYRQR